MTIFLYIKNKFNLYSNFIYFMRFKYYINYKILIILLKFSKFGFTTLKLYLMESLMILFRRTKLILNWLPPH